MRSDPASAVDAETAKLDSYDHAIVAVLLFVMLGFLFREAVKYRQGRQRLLQLQDELEDAEGIHIVTSQLACCNTPLRISLRGSLLCCLFYCQYECRLLDIDL